jgi:hypothetical protein
MNFVTLIKIIETSSHYIFCNNYIKEHQVFFESSHKARNCGVIIIFQLIAKIYQIVLVPNQVKKSIKIIK